MSQIYSLSQERLVMTVNTKPETRNPKALKTASDYCIRPSLEALGFYYHPKVKNMYPVLDVEQKEWCGSRDTLWKLSSWISLDSVLIPPVKSKQRA